MFEKNMRVVKFLSLSTKREIRSKFRMGSAGIVGYKALNLFEDNNH